MSDRKYIVNLTNHLIGRNRYDEAFIRIGDPYKFMDYVELDLVHDEVKVMSPERLGIIMCAFSNYDVRMTKADLASQISYSGDVADMLRQIVAVCLSRVIRDRIDPACPPINLPKWTGRLGGFQLGFRTAIDLIAEG